MKIFSKCHLCLAKWGLFGGLFFFSIGVRFTHGLFVFGGLFFFSLSLAFLSPFLVSRLLVGELGHRRFSPSPALHPHPRFPVLSRAYSRPLTSHLNLSPLPTTAPLVRPIPSAIPESCATPLSTSPQGLGRWRPARNRLNAGVAHAARWNWLFTSILSMWWFFLVV